MNQQHQVVYSGKVGAKARPPRHQVGSKRICKTPYVCDGGPMHGTTLYLESGSTLVFTMANQTGRYVQGEWQCA